MWPSCYSLRFWGAFSCAALLLGCASTLSVDEERDLGAELDAEVRSEVILEPDPVVVKYVQKIGNEIVRAAPPQPYQFHFKVVDDDEIRILSQKLLLVGLDLDLLLLLSRRFSHPFLSLSPLVNYSRHTTPPAGFGTPRQLGG